MFVDPFHCRFNLIECFTIHTHLANNVSFAHRFVSRRVLLSDSSSSSNSSSGIGQMCSVLVVLWKSHLIIGNTFLFLFNIHFWPNTYIYIIHMRYIDSIWLEQCVVLFGFFVFFSLAHINQLFINSIVYMRYK